VYQPLTKFSPRIFSFTHGTPSDQVLEVMVEIYRALRKSGMNQDQARDRILTMEPFQHFESLIKTLSDQLIGGNPA
jgi:hypothetical protein